MALWPPKEFAMLERASGTITGLIVAEDGATPIPGSTLATLTLTLFADDADQTIINGRSDQSVLGVNGGAVSEAGELTMTLAPADNAIVDADLPVERHYALFQWTWGAGKAGKALAVLNVQNLAKVA